MNLLSDYQSNYFVILIGILSIASCATPDVRNSGNEKTKDHIETSPLENTDNTQVVVIQPQQTTRLKEQTVRTETSIWENISQGFMLPDLEHPSIDREYRILLKHPTLLKQNIDSALPFLDFVSATTISKNIPTEIALIPFIESNYELAAKSSSNAKGLWQLMPPTAKSLGLEHSSWQEDSYNLILSTEAALDYFAENYERFDDWVLSIAAYNGGPTRVSRELAKAEHSNQPHVFFSLALSPETRNYLPRLLAYKKLFSEYQSRPEIFSPEPKFNKFSKIIVLEQTSFSVLASIAKMEHQQIIDYNPGYKSWSTPPDSEAVLVLPETSAKIMRQKEKNLSLKQRLPWIEYKIKPGDSLGKIALAHSISIRSIKTLNKLSNDRIIAGKILRIPHTAIEHKDR